MATAGCSSSFQINKVDTEQLRPRVKPKVELKRLLEEAGADKDVFTMKEVMFYLGKYIMSKELYDEQQQHIVHCGEDALGAVLGVKSFSVKEHRALFAMICRNLVIVKNPCTEPDQGPGDTDAESHSSTSQQQRRRRRSSGPESSSVEDEPREHRQRFNDSLSLCVSGSLPSEKGYSEYAETHGNTDEGISHSDGSKDSDSHSEIVEFEVESIDSDDYSENDEDSVPGDDEWGLILPCSLLNRDEGVDMPDGKCSHSSTAAKDEAPAPGSMADSQPTSSQPSTSSGGCRQVETPELNSLDACLPSTILEPCVICQSRPKNGCIVHGRTGHLMACYTCAKKLKNRNKLCPVCREPIQSVLLMFVS